MVNKSVLRSQIISEIIFEIENDSQSIDIHMSLSYVLLNTRYTQEVPVSMVNSTCKDH